MLARALCFVLMVSSAGAAEVTRAGRWELHSSFWMNLHQTLMHDASGRPAHDLEALSSEERAAWDTAVSAHRAVAGGGTEPLWSADGRELFYRNGDRMIAVPVQTTSGFRMGTPDVLFERSFKTGIYNTLSYDVTNDGREFLMIERRAELVPNYLQVVLDWDEALCRRVPAAAS